MFLRTKRRISIFDALESKKRPHRSDTALELSGFRKILPNAVLYRNLSAALSFFTLAVFIFYLIYNSAFKYPSYEHEKELDRTDTDHDKYSSKSGLFYLKLA